MNAITICLGIGCVVFALTNVLLLIKNKALVNERKKYNMLVASEYAKTTPNTILDHLNYIMDREFEYSVDLPFAAKEIKRITDFEGTVHELTTNVSKSINRRFIERAEVAGISEEYILDYVTRGCVIRTMKFMFDHDAGYGGKESTDEE